MGVRGDGGQWGAGSWRPTTGRQGASFGSGSGPHTARWILRGAKGRIVSSGTMRSGGMTAEMKAQGFPKGQLASHTEPKILNQVRPSSGQRLDIYGERPACNACKGAMNRYAEATGARIVYHYPGGRPWVAGG
jgi:hypothetical protein